MAATGPNHYGKITLDEPRRRLLSPYQLVDDAAELIEQIFEKFGDKTEEVLGEDITEAMVEFMIGSGYWDEEDDNDEETEQTSKETTGTS